MAEPTRILMVCMGNICRSPLAENVLRHKARARGLDGAIFVDSAGTGGWHAGDPPDPRSCRVARENGIEMTGAARVISTRDFDEFDLLICMDEDNREHILGMGAPTEKVSLLLEWNPTATIREVPDPYYGGHDGFAQVFDLVDAACRGLLEHLKTRTDGPAANR